jgi:hypothetical protein
MLGTLNQQEELKLQVKMQLSYLYFIKIFIYKLIVYIVYENSL